jgi:hypothetical protein
VDTRWSFEAGEAIREALASEELSGTLLLSAECRSTLCQVEVEHSEEEQWHEFQLLFQEKIAHLLPHTTSSHTDQGDGRSQSLLFLAREGYRLP